MFRPMISAGSRKLELDLNRTVEGSRACIAVQDLDTATAIMLDGRIVGPITASADTVQ